ncbi:MAG: YadA-like family protein, partial [Burkholderiaceae bacterium]
NYTNVQDALDGLNNTANRGFDLTTSASTGTVSGTTTEQIATGETVTLDAGKNIAVTQKGNTITIATIENPNFTTVTTGNTTMGSDGITIKGGANGTVSLTNAGLDNGGNTITNVKAGVNDTDAVNMSQLKAVQEVAAQKTTVSAANNSVKVTTTTNSSGGTNYAVGLADKVTIGSDSATAVTVDGTKGSVTAGSVTVNGAAGTIGGLTNKTFDVENYVSGQAATEDQLAQVVKNLNTVASQHTTVKAGSNTVVSEGTNATGGKEYTVSVADNLKLNSASFTDTAGNTTVVNGAGTTMTDSSGNTTTTSASGVTVSNGSSTVSVTANGLDNGGNTITNVAAGVNDTDAVNVGQVNAALNTVNQSINNLGNKISEVGKESKAGSASAIATANLPQSTIPGMGMTTVGLGTYDGQSAIAVGLSKMSDNGKWVIKASATTNTQGKVGAGVGVGFHW